MKWEGPSEKPERTTQLMSPLLFLFIENNELVNQGIRFKDAPPNYVAWLLIPLGVILFSWFFYKRESEVPTGIRILLTTLRTAAIFFICLLIFDPYRQFLQIDEIRSQVTILVDESGSMTRRDPYEQDPALAQKIRKAADIPAGADMKSFTRSDLATRVLGSSGLDLVSKLEEKHDVKVMGFSSGKPRPLDDLESLSNDGPVTGTGDALSQVLSDPEIQAKPNTSVILVSDGRTNTGIDPVDVARNAGENDRIPIHTVGIGDPNALRDIELRFIRADEVVLRGNTVRMALTIRNDGFDDTFVQISVIDKEGQRWAPIQRKSIKKSDSDQTVEIDITAHRVGRFVLDVTVQGPPGEENTRNNSKQHSLTVKDDKLRVLYVDTLPRWEYRRLKNFLIRGDESFTCQCLLLSAEDSFIQESNQGIPPLESFPLEFEQLDEYDVLILGDIDPALLVPTPSLLEPTLRNIQKFVDNGGGLAVIAGEGWTPHAYVDTPLEEIIPVDITSSGDYGPFGSFTDEWKPRLTAIGRGHPITQLKKDPEENVRHWEEKDFGLMELRWWYPVRKPAPAAQVLAYHPDHRNQFGYYPLLVAGTYGDGPVLFTATDETWRWFNRVGAVYFNRYWGNVVRFLARAHLYRGSRRYKLVSNASNYQQGETVRMTAFVKDKLFEESRAPTQRVMVVEPDTRGRIIEFKKARDQDGQYEHAFKPTKFGRYDAWIVGEEGLAGERYAPISFEVTFIDPERQNPAMDEESLTEIAQASGGAYFRLEEAAGVFDRLQADTSRRTKVQPRPLKSRAWIPILFVLLLTLEWVIRKRFRMV